MSIVGRCPQCGFSSVLEEYEYPSYTYPGTSESRFICDECVFKNNQEWHNENYCPGCAELWDDCTCNGGAA